jgi:Domain of unknown function (DUF892)
VSIWSSFFFAISWLPTSPKGSLCYPPAPCAADRQVLDAAIVGAAQSVADELGRDDVVRLLTTNLNEAKAADKKLSTIALRKGVNRKAAS